MRTRGAWWAWAALVGGCGGDARVDFSAADALGAVAGQMERTLREYHQEISRFDDSREEDVVAAFVTRVRKNPGDEPAADAHAGELTAALRKIRGDRETEWTRQSAAMENVDVLREVSRGVRRMAVQSLSLQDDMRRYLTGWIEAQRQAGDRPAPRPQTEGR